jgi:hypothetical protein
LLGWGHIPSAKLIKAAINNSRGSQIKTSTARTHKKVFFVTTEKKFFFSANQKFETISDDFFEPHFQRTPMQLNRFHRQKNTHRLQRPNSTLTEICFLSRPGLPDGLFSNQKSKFG